MDINIPQQTSNEIAANGPIPGDVSLYEKELAGCQKINTPGYYSSLNGAENADSERSSLFPAASFTGSFTESNQVYAYSSEDIYPGASYINNRRPGELYIVGGDFPPMSGIMPAGPYLAKADAASGKQIWRTYLDNANVSKHWIGNANLNILPNGNIALAWSRYIVLIDGDTGSIFKHKTLPTGQAPPADVNYKHLTITPDGTLILKDQTRPTGFNFQGTAAIIKGVMEGFKQPNSHLVAVDPITLSILDEMDIPEPATAPHTITTLDGKTAIYVPTDSGVIRYFWDSNKKKLSKDSDWIVKPAQPGQTAVCAPSILGDWIILQTNGCGSMAAASSVVSVNQRDHTKMNVIFPFGNALQKGEWSFAPPKNQTDPENNLLYSADMGMQKVACISIDPKSGELTIKYILEDITNTFQSLIGPKEKRVQILSNIKPNVQGTSMQELVFNGDYTEQVTWREASTGRILAESDFFEPLTINSLIVPGFGGRFYYPTLKKFYILQVLPKV